MNPILGIAVLLYGLFLLFYVVWSAFLLYHLFRFSPQKDTAVTSSVVFLAVTLLLLLISLASFRRVDWSSGVVFPPLTSVF